MVIQYNKTNPNKKEFTGEAVQVLRPNALSGDDAPVDLATLSYVNEQNAAETEARINDISSLDTRLTTETTERINDISALDTSIENESTLRKAKDDSIDVNIQQINDKIPGTASSTNQLADKDFVNSSITTMSAHFLTYDVSGNPFPTKASLDNAVIFFYGGSQFTPTEHDYCLVNEDETHNDNACRYAYTNGEWTFQYKVNDTAFTQEQLAVLDSGITKTKVQKLDTVEQGAQVNVQSDWNQTNERAADYIKNKPDITKHPVEVSLGGNDPSFVDSTLLNGVDKDSVFPIRLDAKIFYYDGNNVRYITDSGTIGNARQVIDDTFEGPSPNDTISMWVDTRGNVHYTPYNSMILSDVHFDGTTNEYVLTWTREELTNSSTSNIINFDGKNVWQYNGHVYISEYDKQYEVHDDGTITPINWAYQYSEDVPEYGQYVTVIHGIAIYVNGSSRSYFDTSTNKWMDKRWVGTRPFYGDQFWDGLDGNIYYTADGTTYKVIGDTVTDMHLEGPFEWPGNLSPSYGSNIWTDSATGDIYYLFNNTSLYYIKEVHGETSVTVTATGEELVLKDSLKTIDGESIIGKGDIKINTVPGQLQTDINGIKELIPSQASSENKLADKAFVNSSIATNTAYFKGTFNSLAELEAVPDVTNNDYGFVKTLDAAGNVVYNRYKYNAESSKWVFEYPLNNSSFTAEQWSAINSGITSGKIAEIDEAISQLSFNASLSHNIPRLVPKDITAYITDGSFWERLAGTNGYALFEDIYVGDYFQMSRAISAYERTGQYQATGSQYVTIAGLDTMMNNGDHGSGVDYHHAVMVPGQGFGGTQHFGRSRMNATNTTEGGYKASEMNTLVLGDVVSAGSTAANATINQQLYAEFGPHLKTTRELVSNAINATGYNRFGSASGCSSQWEWISAQAILMSEIEVYGSIAWSSAGFDTGNANRQLPLFAFSKQAQNNHSAYWWFKDIASAAFFCCSADLGENSYGYANLANFSVRPRFIIA